MSSTLKKRKDFVRVAVKGLKMVRHSLILQAAQSLSKEEVPYKLGFTATKKLGKAHIRNRTKRRLRAAAQEIFPKHAQNNIEYVLIGRYSTREVDFKELCSDMAFAVKRINKDFKKKDGNDEEISQPIPDSAS